MNGDQAALGIDVGGTKIAIGELSLDGTRRELAVVPTVQRNGRANLSAIADAIARFASPGSPVGISLATTVDAAGRARDPRGWFGWTGIDLVQELDAAHRVEIIPDAACGAVAEARWGAGGGARRVLYVTLGTGIAHCLVTAGVPDTGSHGAGILSGSTAPFRSGWRTRPSWLTVEDIASGPGLAAAFAGSVAATDSHALAAAFRARDWWARRTVEHASWQVGSLIAALATSTDPDVIVLGGGLATGFPEYVDLIDGVLEVLLHDWHTPLTPSVPARFGAESCWIGAAGLAALGPSTAVSSATNEGARGLASSLIRKEHVDV